MRQLRAEWTASEEQTRERDQIEKAGKPRSPPLGAAGTLWAGGPIECYCLYSPPFP